MWIPGNARHRTRKIFGLRLLILSEYKSFWTVRRCEFALGHSFEGMTRIHYFEAVLDLPLNVNMSEILNKRCEEPLTKVVLLRLGVEKFVSYLDWTKSVAEALCIPQTMKESLQWPIGMQTEDREKHM